MAIQQQITGIPYPSPINSSNIQANESLVPVNTQPMSGALPNLNQMQTDFNNYWKQSTPGQSINWAGGTLTNQGNGNALYTNKDNTSEMFTSGTSLADIAKGNDDISRYWNQQYGTNFNTNPMYNGESANVWGGNTLGVNNQPGNGWSGNKSQAAWAAGDNPVLYNMGMGAGQAPGQVMTSTPQMAGDQGYVNNPANGAISMNQSGITGAGPSNYPYGPQQQLSIGSVANSLNPYKASVDTSTLSGLGQQAQNNYNTYSNRIQGYYNDPSSFKLNPAYQSQYNLGLDAVSRQQAALGNYGSGNALYALDKYGNDLANQAWNSEIQNLGTLANQNGQLANSAYGTGANIQGNLASSNNNLLGNVYGNLLNNQIAQQNANTAGQAAMWNAYNNNLQTQGNLANMAYNTGANAWGQDFNQLGALSGLNMNGGGQINAGGVPTSLGSQGASNNALGQILQYLGQNGIGNIGNYSF